VTQPITLTDDSGAAGVQWTLGDRMGLQRLTASVENLDRPPVTFTATVLF
jgi:hypothetical protein